MRRGKPQQQIYRPGSGPLRKSNQGIEETESDTNLLVNSRQNQTRYYDDAKHRSEGSSPRFSVDNNTSTRLADISLNKDQDKDFQRRSKKPEQMLYVPRAVVQAREINSVPNSDREHIMQNGNDRNYDSNDRLGNQSKRYSNRRRNENDYQNEWREKSPSVSRHVRQGSEPRGINNAQNWQRRDRDTRSVEPSLMTHRNYNSEKIQVKPPSGRRHSTIGLEPEKRQKPPINLENLPPRLKKKYLAENATPEENWDGTSLTFQQNFNKNNPSYHHMGSYNNLPSGQNIHNQNQGYHTLPNRPRGRGRFTQPEFEVPPGQTMYRSMTPDQFRSPCNSRPPTPPPSSHRKGDSGPQTPLNYPRNNNQRNYDSKNYNDQRLKTNITERLKNLRQSEPRTFPSRETENRSWDEHHREYDNHRRDNNRNNRRDDYNRRNNRRDRRSSSKESQRKGSNGREIIEEDYAGDGNRNESGNKNEATPVRSGFRESLEAQMSPVSPATSEEAEKPVAIVINTNTTGLDWNEEVELNDKLEAEALSDALTRSSSLTSLQDISTKSMPSSVNTSLPSHKKSKRRNRRRSRQRGDSHGGDHSHIQRKNSITSIESRDNFKIPQDHGSSRRKRHSRDRMDKSYDRFHTHSRNPSRECSFDRNPNRVSENWREEILRSRQNSEREDHHTHERKSRNNSEREELKLDTKKAGIIVLPSKSPEPIHQPSLTAHTTDHPRYPETRKSPAQPKILFDPNNPSKPILVKTPGSRISVPGFCDSNTDTSPPQIHTTDQFGNVRPAWYDENTEEFRSCHFPNLLRDIKRADTELQCILNSGSLLVNWGTVANLRQFLMEALEYLLCKALKFSQTENVEQHLWKILYYNIIEVTRKAITNDQENKQNYKGFLIYLIDEGSKYFEGLLNLLEDTYKFKLNNFLGSNNLVPQKGLGYVGLALISAQKLLLFLGDLGRYREQVNETSSYGKCRQWYIKSHEINPKNGKPYNQLALLAVYSRRKLDAVYYYMRSLMSSNPVPSARESLISLFDENRKKYEQGEKKRREERLERHRQQMKQKESEEVSAPNSLRKETWIHPEGGRRFHRTTKASEGSDKDSEEEDLASLSSVEVNKRFVISYLYVHGKLITKIGMESFQETAMQMLKEFRALLQHSPVPLPCNRFLQLLALNMFAIESTQLKDPHLQSGTGYRSELQERALVVSLQMFNLILERCVSILEEHVAAHKDGTVNSLPPDANVLLPAIKIWCDWMLCHTSVWNPPPSTQDFKVGTSGDAWSRLAVLMNLLEKMEQTAADGFIKEPREGYEPVRLPEDAALSGFTPLIYNGQDPTYAPKDVDSELGQFALRLSKLLFFGTVYLCGLEPPVLKLEIEDDVREYVSVVCTSNSRDSPPTTRELAHSTDILLESFSGDEEEDGDNSEDVNVDTPSEIRDLLSRKNELEKRKKSQDLHRQRVMKILSQSVVSVHIEVRPKYLIPDTNCFIDHLPSILAIAQSHCYTLMVPIVVLSELEGLSRGGQSPAPLIRSYLDPQHVRKVAQSAKKALEFLKQRHASVKCVTTKGAIIASTTFSTEEDTTWDASLKNDDKILTTCLVLCKGHKEQTQEAVEGQPRQLVREVVLLTEDRNLRVKAHARDVPVRELPDFMRWAGLGG